MISILLAAMFLAALIQAPFRSKARPRRQGGLRRVDTKALQSGMNFPDRL
jgi:hypothetical protein